jgi:hypothetical protein
MRQISDMGVKPTVELVDLENGPGEPGVPGCWASVVPVPYPFDGFSHVDGTPLCWAGEQSSEFTF